MDEFLGDSFFDEDPELERMAEDINFQYDTLHDTCYYVYDVFLGDFRTVTPFEEVPNRPCMERLVSLNGQLYAAYTFPNHTLLIPRIFGNEFNDVILFGANDCGMTYSIWNKKGDTLTYQNYELSLEDNPKDGVVFRKNTISAPVDSEEFAEAVQKAGSLELFFSGHHYSEFLERKDCVSRTYTEIRETLDKAEGFTEKITDLYSSLDKFLNGKREFIPILNPDIPLFDIADSLEEGYQK